ncbi:MAG: phosphosulfolactate synthase [Hyphomicrobiaceae bacterium]
MLEFEKANQAMFGTIATPIPGKSRTVIIDYGPDYMGWTGQSGIADLLDAASDYISAAKIWTMNAILLKDSYLKGVVERYTKAGVPTFAGGLLFEYAYLKNDLDGLLARLKSLGLKGLEISENYAALDEDTRLRSIERFSKAGIEIVYEFGRKHPETPLEIEELARIVKSVQAAGASHVILEQGELDQLRESAPDRLAALVKEPWFSDIDIEIDQTRCPAILGEVVAAFGPTVNLANVPPGCVIRLEGFRRGLGRSLDFPLFRHLVSQGR